MKVQLKAMEIVDPEIHSISLVKHGANRSPFKILKAEVEKAEPTKFEKALAEFCDYLTRLVKASPESEKTNLQAEFEAPKVVADIQPETTGDADMTKTAVIKEAVPGDLEGLNDDKAPVEIKEEVVKEEAKVETAAETKVEAAATEVEKGPGMGAACYDSKNKKKGMMKAVEDGKLVEKAYEFVLDEAGKEIFLGFVEVTKEEVKEETLAPVITAPVAVDLKPLADAVAQLTATMTEQLAKMETRVKEAEGLAKSAKDKSDNTTVILRKEADFDPFTTAAAARGRVEKRESGRVFKGLLPGIEALAGEK